MADVVVLIGEMGMFIKDDNFKKIRNAAMT